MGRPPLITGPELAGFRSGEVAEGREAGMPCQPGRTLPGSSECQGLFCREPRHMSALCALTAPAMLQSQSRL